MKKQTFVISLLLLTTIASCQNLSRKEFDSFVVNLPVISSNTSFNDIVCGKYMNYQDYHKLTYNYNAYDSVYTYSENNKKWVCTWSGTAKTDSSIENINNRDENGKVIPNAPRQIVYHNKFCILGKLDLHSDYTVIAIKVEIYGYFVIHLFSYNKDGILVSVIPIGKVEKSPLKENWFTIQKGIWNKDNTIWASYLAAGYVELTYTFTSDGRFKVIKRFTEE